GGNRTLIPRLKVWCVAVTLTTPLNRSVAFARSCHRSLLLVWPRASGERGSSPLGSRTPLAGLKDRRHHRTPNGPRMSGEREGEGRGASEERSVSPLAPLYSPLTQWVGRRSNPRLRLFRPALGRLSYQPNEKGQASRDTWPARKTQKKA